MGARVLVVDDSPTIRRVVATILERRSFEPIVAEDGQTRSKSSTRRKSI
jgi:DNA-binding response OmpR family regulator